MQTSTFGASQILDIACGVKVQFRAFRQNEPLCMWFTKSKNCQWQFTLRWKTSNSGFQPISARFFTRTLSKMVFKGFISEPQGIRFQRHSLVCVFGTMIISLSLIYRENRRIESLIWFVVLPHDFVFGGCLYWGLKLRFLIDLAIAKP